METGYRPRAGRGHARRRRAMGWQPPFGDNDARAHDARLADRHRHGGRNRHGAGRHQARRWPGCRRARRRRSRDDHRVRRLHDRVRTDARRQDLRRACGRRWQGPSRRALRAGGYSAWARIRGALLGVHARRGSAAPRDRRRRVAHSVRAGVSRDVHARRPRQLCPLRADAPSSGRWRRTHAHVRQPGRKRPECGARLGAHLWPRGTARSRRQGRRAGHGDHRVARGHRPRDPLGPRRHALRRVRASP